MDGVSNICHEKIHRSEKVDIENEVSRMNEFSWKMAVETICMLLNVLVALCAVKLAKDPDI